MICCCDEVVGGSGAWGNADAGGDGVGEVEERLDIGDGPAVTIDLVILLLSGGGWGYSRRTCRL